MRFEVHRQLSASMHVSRTVQQRHLGRPGGTIPSNVDVAERLVAISLYFLHAT